MITYINHKERMTGSTSSGSLTLKTQRISGGRANQIYIKPATVSTTYDIVITDRDGDVAFEMTGARGTINKIVEFPIQGVYTFTITNASADEAFVAFMFVGYC